MRGHAAALRERGRPATVDSSADGGVMRAQESERPAAVRLRDLNGAEAREEGAPANEASPLDEAKLPRSGGAGRAQWWLALLAALATASALLLSVRFGVNWDAAPAPSGLVSPSVRRALAVFWVEALEGGLSGALAMVVNIFMLLWLRTTMNFQYKHGGGFLAALAHLHKEGGVRRLYAGLIPALIQAPLARFGDTAANDGVRAALGVLEMTAAWPVGYVSVVCSLVAGLFRVVLMPLEVVKTSMQVQGSSALRGMRDRLRRHGPCVLWEGLLVTFGAHFAGHFPWFASRNMLMSIWPAAGAPMTDTLRLAVIGLLSSLVSDLVSNPLRVIKTVKQVDACHVCVCVCVCVWVCVD